MILSFKCKETQALFEGKTVKRFRAFVSIAQRKLAQLHAAQTLDFLRSPLGDNLAALKGDRKGQHSIRVNDQWRVSFVWTKAGPANVEIVDYH
jgi:toxin HigB-1